MLRRTFVRLGGPARVWAAPEELKAYSSTRLAEIHMASEKKGEGFRDMRRKMQARKDQGWSYAKLKERTGMFQSESHNYRAADKIPDMTPPNDQEIPGGFPYPAAFFFAFFTWFWWMWIQAQNGSRAQYVVPDPHREHRFIKMYYTPGFVDEGNEPLVKNGICTIRPGQDFLSDRVVPHAVRIGH
eukprot:TRINITY_DN4617_c0_g1_i2.p1 TRINITY_DN4617_c0_g1~~TRINITY_DN4617_c0_g1_i2.p1  ORF type:complete len:198 (+),score=44.63 TRINITY_DN4617_c0_g1_i2:40-594(+)